MNQHGVNDLLTTKPTLDTLGLSKAQKTALYTLIASVRPKSKPRFGPMNENGDYPPEEYENGGYNQALQDYDNAIKELLK